MEPGIDKQRVRGNGPRWAVLTGLGALLLKLKWVMAALKLGKFTVTLVSMVVTIGVYALLFGLPFAVGFIALLLIHELGHAAVLKYRGIDAGAPVFIPLVGAAIAMRQLPPDAKTEAEVGIGGPIAGAMAATLCWGIFRLTGSTFWCALAYIGFVMNLFNLLPVTPLDGGRVAGAISCWLWIPGILLLGVILWLRFSPILVLVVVMGTVQLWGEYRRADAERERYYAVPWDTRVRIAVLYFGLAAYLGYAGIATHDILVHLS